MDTDPTHSPAPASGTQRLMPIGIFARITGLSHRALRLYADRGLLPPAHVDPRPATATTTCTPSARGRDDPPPPPTRRAAGRDAPVHRRRRAGPRGGDHRPAAGAPGAGAGAPRRRARGCSAGSTSSTACSAQRRPSSWSTSPPSAACSGRGRWPASEFHESYIELAAVLARRAQASGLDPGRDASVVLLGPADDRPRRWRRDRAPLPCSASPWRGCRRRSLARPTSSTWGRPVRAQRLHRPVRGRLPLRIRAPARVARRQRPRAPRSAAHALRARRARHGGPGRLRHRARSGRWATRRLPGRMAPRRGRRTSPTAGCGRSGHRGGTAAGARRPPAPAGRSSSSLAGARGPQQYIPGPNSA